MKTKIILSLIILSILSGCTHVSIERDGVKASYTTVDLFRLRNSSINYDPATGEINANISRQQAISPELLDAAVRAAVTASNMDPLK
jgi:hypothetical protein